MKQGPEGKGHSITLTAHGDGTYHTQDEGHDGPYSLESGKRPGRVEHPSIGHALMHIAAKHGTEGDHVHVHAHEDGFTTHHVKDGGKVQGPHESKTLAAVKKHLSDVVDEEGNEE